MQQKKYGDAIAHFERASPFSMYNKYWLAMANEGAGNEALAKDLLQQIAVYNFNGVDYALIRNEVKKKLAKKN